jgi:hypothetical protein
MAVRSRHAHLVPIAERDRAAMARKERPPFTD